MTAAPYTIRDSRGDDMAGDMAWVVRAQADYYAAANGWRGAMEPLLVETTGNFARDYVPGRSNCWIAERGGERVGAIFCVDAGDNIAKLRLLHVDCAARGLGLGQDLVRRCVDFARVAGYREIMLWTHSVLIPARRIYAAAGFVITETAVHDTFGKPEPGETWRLAL